MKKKLTTLVLALGAGLAFGHEGIELGPNQGRILEFSSNETLHGEVTEKDGTLHIAVLDKDMKPVKVEAQGLAVTAGTREKPVKMEITKLADGFTLSVPADGEWLIMQFKETADAKAIIARLNYNTKNCEPCGQPEWRCACGGKE
jgi:hypothetical protein